MTDQSLQTPAFPTPPVAAPRRTGQPRPFWMILLLSVFTLGIYYVIYHFTVNSELRRMRDWTDEDPYKPSIFFFMYLGLTLLWVFEFVMIATVVVKTVIDAAALDISSLESDYSAFGTQFDALFSAFGIFLGLAALLVKFYFLKLNDYAAKKAGAAPRGIAAPFVLYLIYVGMGIGFQTLSLVGSLVGVEGGNVQLDPATLGEGALGAALAIMFFAGLFLLVYFGLIALFLWKQTQLVNWVWEGGRFAGDPATPVQPAPAPLNAPHAPIPPEPDPRHTPPAPPADRADEETPPPTESGPAQ
ncbi:MAG TPA: DUF4234 domain-containing protein [candidate division Zixibacteria bacterium]|nr:DUF4234 domain-containing protein [candidate division Zixibacteria bacterium]